VGGDGSCNKDVEHTLLGHNEEDVPEEEADPETEEQEADPETEEPTPDPEPVAEDDDCECLSDNEVKQTKRNG